MVGTDDVWGTIVSVTVVSVTVVWLGTAVTGGSVVADVSTTGTSCVWRSCWRAITAMPAIIATTAAAEASTSHRRGRGLDAGTSRTADPVRSSANPCLDIGSSPGRHRAHQ